MRVLVSFEYESSADNVHEIKDELEEEYFYSFADKIENLEVEDID